MSDREIDVVRDVDMVKKKSGLLKRWYEWTLKTFGKDESSRRIVKFFFVTLCSRVLCFWVRIHLSYQTSISKISHLKYQYHTFRNPTECRYQTRCCIYSYTSLVCSNVSRYRIVCQVQL